MLRPLLKRVRAYPPVNRAATSSARAAARIVPAIAGPGERHLPRMGVVRSALPNDSDLVLEGAGDEPWSNTLFWRGWDHFYEPETLPVFFQLALQAHTVLDIGANVGIFTLVAGHANPRARVVAFEPDQRAFQRLVRHVELNALTNVECYMQAVADVDGELTLHTARAVRPEESVAVSAQTSITRAHVEAEGERVQRIEEVRSSAVTVDAFVAAHDIDAVDLVKIDVEGAEARVLGGMAETLQRHRPGLVCEVLDADAGQRLEQALGPLGYEWFHLTWEGPVRRDHVVPAGGGVWPNYLFTCND